ncbi:hypothetical protein EYF80_035733 [Liparis tanakae]|uniref:Uncharacterized protein n=1 Tax=Liparis tanakae TaxID=230148 RepID=A0A4Z2GN10_9TELE|nr:hypothetical protein EYF80_035733 [Liparis tanakae]
MHTDGTANDSPAEGEPAPPRGRSVETPMMPAHVFSSLSQHLRSTKKDGRRGRTMSSASEAERRTGLYLRDVALALVPILLFLGRVNVWRNTLVGVVIERKRRRLSGEEELISNDNGTESVVSISMIRLQRSMSRGPQQLAADATLHSVPRSPEAPPPLLHRAPHAFF